MACNLDVPHRSDHACIQYPLQLAFWHDAREVQLPLRQIKAKCDRVVQQFLAAMSGHHLPGMHLPQVGRGLVPTPSIRPALPNTAANRRPSELRKHTKLAAQAGGNDAGSGEATLLMLDACSLVQGSTLCVVPSRLHGGRAAGPLTAGRCKQHCCRSLRWHLHNLDLAAGAFIVQAETQVRRASGRTRHSQPTCRSVCTADTAAAQLQEAWLPGRHDTCCSRQQTPST